MYTISIATHVATTKAVFNPRQTRLFRQPGGSPSRADSERASVAIVALGSNQTLCSESVIVNSTAFEAQSSRRFGETTVPHMARPGAFQSRLTTDPNGHDNASPSSPRSKNGMWKVSGRFMFFL
jgi:hypothetical protein